MKRIRQAAIGVASLLMSYSASAQVEVSVSVDTTKPGPKIERAVYGQFAEHLGRGIYEGIWVGKDSSIPNVKGYRKDVVEALRKIKVPVIRWPGGCFADDYDWRDGIGPAAQRPERMNKFWGGVPETNAFGTHEFMDFTELIGADAYVAANMGSGTPREMARWLEYMTADGTSTLAKERRANGREKPWKVKYLGVGNESWGCGGEMRPEFAGDLSRQFGSYARLHGGSAFRVASGGSADDFNWTDVMMERAGKYFDAISLHYYTIPLDWGTKGQATGFPKEEWGITLRNAQALDGMLVRHEAIMDKHDPEKRVALSVDEWGTWYDQEPGSTPGFLYQQNSLRDAMVAALTLNIFHRHTERVKMANIAQMVNVLQAMILTDKERMLLTPTYHLFDLYVPFQGAIPFPAKVNSPRYIEGDVDIPMVDASAAKDANGKMWLSLVNLDPNKAVRITTDFTGKAKGRMLTAAKIDSHNTFDKPDTVKPVAYSGRTVGGKLVFDLPAKAIAVVAIN
ncbi:alpha-N-arabinofuranosidase [Altererythrobacter sp.]|uniref:alpha-N-arabinofuranosidase n=1 Tax=Altererythrobacter sp. TaxID=1872480 RepID=UPI003D1213A1